MSTFGNTEVRAPKCRATTLVARTSSAWKQVNLIKPAVFITNLRHVRGVYAILLLTLSNLFMTFAWHGHPNLFKKMA